MNKEEVINLNNLFEKYKETKSGQEGLSSMGGSCWDEDGSKAICFVVLESLDADEMEILQQETKKASDIINEKLKEHRTKKQVKAEQLTTLEKLKQKLKVTLNEGDLGQAYGASLRPNVYLNNGVNLSIQASSGHYSQPRKILSCIGDYQEVEMMVIAGGDTLNYEAVKDYFEVLGDDGFNWKGDVIAYVPLEKVVEFIDANGGLV